VPGIYRLASYELSNTLLQIGIDKAEQYLAILLYLHKKLLEQRIKDAKKWIEEQKTTWARKTEFPGMMFIIERAEKIIKEIDSNIAGFPTIKESVKKLEEENVFEKILEIINK
jgi:hypothetical protein